MFVGLAVVDLAVVDLAVVGLAVVGVVVGVGCSVGVWCCVVCWCVDGLVLILFDIGGGFSIGSSGDTTRAGGRKFVTTRKKK